MYHRRKMPSTRNAPLLHRLQYTSLTARRYLSTVFLYCATSASALIVYHHLTTIDEEYQQLRRAKFSSALMLYMANRYTALVYAVYTPFHWGLLVHLAKPSNICTSVSTVKQTFECLQYLPWAGWYRPSV
ncbi:hypothetical protein C8Q79DRAFT_187848 [Trametes meyenii]|nr:hypothetical protein C8Q79DRAFT_187848 [Trametes meyenii]